jgi:hypothetical protein
MTSGGISPRTHCTSEWGTPRQIENGVVPEELLQGRYGHQLHVWDLRRRRHVQALDLGKEYQMVLEMRPAHDPTKTYEFVGVVVSLKDLGASVWLWHRQNGAWQIEKVIEIRTMNQETAHDLHAAHGGHSGHGADLDLLNHPWLAGAAVVVHTLGHLLVAGLVATIVYEKLGVRILQRAWFNFDLAWAIALIVSGFVTALL